MKIVEIFDKLMKDELKNEKNAIHNNGYQILSSDTLESVGLFNDDIKKRFAQINTENYFKQMRNIGISDVYAWFYLILLLETNRKENIQINNPKRRKTSKEIMSKESIIDNVLYKMDPIVISIIMWNTKFNHTLKFKHTLKNEHPFILTSKGFKKLLRSRNKNNIFSAMRNSDDPKKMLYFMSNVKNFEELILKCSDERIVALAIEKSPLQPKNESLSDSNTFTGIEKQDLRYKLLNTTDLYRINENSFDIYLNNMQYVGLSQLFRLTDHYKTIPQLKKIISRLNFRHVASINSIKHNQNVVNTTKRSLLKLSLQNISVTKTDLEKFKSIDRIAVMRTIIDESFDHMLDLYQKLLNTLDVLSVFLFQCQLFDYIKECHRSFIKEEQKHEHKENFLVLGSINIGGAKKKSSRKIKKAKQFMKMIRNLDKSTIFYPFPNHISDKSTLETFFTSHVVSDTFKNDSESKNDITHRFNILNQSKADPQLQNDSQLKNQEKIFRPGIYETSKNGLQSYKKYDNVNSPSTNISFFKKAPAYTLIETLVIFYLNGCFKQNDYLLVDLIDYFDDISIFNLKDYRTSILQDKRISLDQKIDLIDRYHEILEINGIYQPISFIKENYSKLTAYEIRHLGFSDDCVEHIISYRNTMELSNYQVKNFIWFVDRFLNSLNDLQWIITKCENMINTNPDLKTLIESISVKIKIKIRAEQDNDDNQIDKNESKPITSEKIVQPQNGPKNQMVAAQAPSKNVQTIPINSENGFIQRPHSLGDKGQKPMLDTKNDAFSDLNENKHNIRNNSSYSLQTKTHQMSQEPLQRNYANKQYSDQKIDSFNQDPRNTLQKPIGVKNQLSKPEKSNNTGDRYHNIGREEFFNYQKNNHNTENHHNSTDKHSNNRYDNNNHNRNNTYSRDEYDSDYRNQSFTACSRGSTYNNINSRHSHFKDYYDNSRRSKDFYNTTSYSRDPHGSNYNNTSNTRDSYDNPSCHEDSYDNLSYKRNYYNSNYNNPPYKRYSYANSSYNRHFYNNPSYNRDSYDDPYYSRNCSDLNYNDTSNNEYSYKNPSYGRDSHDNSSYGKDSSYDNPQYKRNFYDSNRNSISNTENSYDTDHSRYDNQFSTGGYSRDNNSEIPHGMDSSSSSRNYNFGYLSNNSDRDCRSNQGSKTNHERSGYNWNRYGCGDNNYTRNARGYNEQNRNHNSMLLSGRYGTSSYSTKNTIHDTKKQIKEQNSHQTVTYRDKYLDRGGTFEKQHTSTHENTTKTWNKDGSTVIDQTRPTNSDGEMYINSNIKYDYTATNQMQATNSDETISLNSKNKENSTAMDQTRSTKSP